MNDPSIATGFRVISSWSCRVIDCLNCCCENTYCNLLALRSTGAGSSTTEGTAVTGRPCIEKSAAQHALSCCHRASRPRELRWSSTRRSSATWRSLLCFLPLDLLDLGLHCKEIPHKHRWDERVTTPPEGQREALVLGLFTDSSWKSK